jgi:ABC-type multidrug transport system permease subunit
MARSAVLFGRSVSDVIYNGGILIVLMVSGLLVGWSINNGIPAFLFGVALALAYAFVMSWVGVWLGLRLPSVEVAQQVSFIVILPLTFVSNVFVPIGTLPDWLQPVAAWNPVSTLTASLRELRGNPNPFPSDGLPADYPVLVTMGWMLVLLAIFAPLGVRRYRSISS